MGHCLILARVTHIFVTFKASGESTLKVEQSCGLFYQTKLTLAHGTWYLERSSGGYCILPEYRAGRRFPTRLDANVAADLILTFDSYIPKIHSRADTELRRRKEAKLTTDQNACFESVRKQMHTSASWQSSRTGTSG